MDNAAKKEVPQRIIGAIADEMEVSFQTAKRWFDSRDIRLTTDKAKKVFAQERFVWEDLEEPARA